MELARRFGLKTVAEGIETTHESHKLQGIGCHVGQGYLFAKPMDKAKFIFAAAPPHHRRPGRTRARGAEPEPAASAVERAALNTSCPAIV